LAWTEVREVYRLDKLINNTFRKTELKLVKEDGQAVLFNHMLADYDRFADLVQNAHAPLLIASKRADLDRGGADFGPVVLRRNSISVQGKDLLWEQINQLGIIRGMLLIRDAGRRSDDYIVTALASIPNYIVLFTLMSELGKAPAQLARV